MYPVITQRNPAEMKRRITNMLRARGIDDIDQLEIEAADGVILLRGHVGTDRVRRACVAASRHVPGAIHVVDCIVVDGLADHDVKQHIGNGPQRRSAAAEYDVAAIALQTV